MVMFRPPACADDCVSICSAWLQQKIQRRSVVCSSTMQSYMSWYLRWGRTWRLCPCSPRSSCRHPHLWQVLIDSLLKFHLLRPPFSSSFPQLQEEKLLLRQQHSSGVVPDDTFKYVHSRPVQRPRLKHAVLCITRLMKEKQQLIEMCNRLRGVMASSGFKGVVTHTWHTQN